MTLHSPTSTHEFYRGKTVLVTGGLGFLGSNLAHAAAANGARVRILDSLHPMYGGNRFNIEGLDVDLAIADLRDEAAVEHAVAGSDVVFHIAAQTSHVDSMTDPFTDLDVNCRGTLILLQALRRHSATLVYAGTRGQYGRLLYTPVDERHPLAPTDLYGVHKAAAEQACLLWGRVHGFPVTSLRINNTYGPRHQMKHGKYGIFNWFVRLAMEDRTLPVFEPGTQLRDYNYVDDVTEAFLLCGSLAAANGHVFNLGSGEPVRFVDMVDAIVAAVGAGRREMVPWPRDREQIEVGDYVASYDLIHRLLGWRPRVTLTTGLTQTVAFYRAHHRHYWDAANSAVGRVSTSNPVAVRGDAEATP